MIGRIIETDADVAEGAAHLAALEPRFAKALALTGPLPLRRRADGFATLFSAIVSQQVSTAAAAASGGRREARGATARAGGRAAAEVALPGGGTLAVAQFGAGDVFGEMALIERGVCTATVSAVTEVEASFVEREDFRALVASRDAAALEVQRALTSVLAAKLRALNAKVRSFPSAEERAARETPAVDLSGARTPAFDWRAFLPLLPFFEGFDRQEIDDVVAIGRALDLEGPAWIFAPGEAPSACFLVLRGAVEVLSRNGNLERRVAIAGPGELVGYLAALEKAPHAASARVRERATLLELPAQAFARLHGDGSRTSVRVQHAIHASLLRSLGRTNHLLARLISHARLTEGSRRAAELESALHGQIWRSADNVNSS
jgi:CRP-like cAMP-binding protein